jgi:adenylyltransferase/sulfurtransferase
MKQIQALELKHLMDSGKPCQLVDVREAYEVEICRIPEALHIPMATVGQRLEEISSEKTVIIVCKSGNRAMAVANWLSTDFSRNNVAYLEGGMLSWIETVQPQLETY